MYEYLYICYKIITTRIIEVELSMTQQNYVQKTESFIKKVESNIKTIVIVSIVLAVVMVVAVFLTGGFGGGLSGRYYATYSGEVNEDVYIEFNTFGSKGRMVSEWEITEFTYELRTTNTGAMRLYGTDNYGQSSAMGDVSLDKSELRIGGITFVKK